MLQGVGISGANPEYVMNTYGHIRELGLKDAALAELVAALRERRIRGAALDVYDREPLPEGHPLYGLDNVLLSPHCADRVEGWLETAMTVFLENHARFLAGDTLRNIVDKQAGY